ncbi:ABC transporter substrate-binding protein [Phormidium pseudopriestleyi FRX01]|uniref:ABC transporter substrate-binding protein n=1 Tax=Phormidium pseudopriestleyi FRX01 TaxID=1759528 RepID=A0ABS3FW68_9CYAN|nr:ABC transporter substrate-binding protein [Phormidium pseudopriestleyi]MBO0351336.1 ABC transporter substrate-binding protein [Phormidium pseudopriestleyi FRX01]
MSQKNETVILIVALLLTGGLVAVGYFAFSQWQSRTGTDFRPSASSPTARNDSRSSSISGGEQLLISSKTSPAKQQGIEALSEGNYFKAVSELEASLKQNRNDPEALIYLNNARIGGGSSYTIAASVPITTSENSAQEILRGVAQAQNEVNQAGGINGLPLRVVIADDANNPNQAEQVAQSLVADDQVLGVVGHFGSDVTLAASRVYEQGQLVAISPTSTSIQLSTAGNFIFRTVPSDRFTANTLAKYMVGSLNLNQAAIFYNENSSYSRSLKDEFTTALYGDGGTVVAQINLVEANFNSFDAVESATQQGAEAIVLLANTETVSEALQVLRVNAKTLPVLGGDSLYRPEVLQVGSDSEGMVVAIPWHILNNPNSGFSMAATQLWGASINWRTTMAYDATQALIAGISVDSTRQGVQRVLSEPGFLAQGGSGNIRFLPSGDRNQATELVKVEPGTRSGLGYDFIPIP